MADMTILTVTLDDEFLSVLRGQLHETFPGSTRVILASSLDEACSLLPMSHPRLVVVHWTAHGSHLEDLNRLLWATTTLARQVPVLVVADRYRVDQATKLYRMGVREYISRTHHAEQYGRILEVYLRHAAAGGPDSASGEAPVRTTKPWATAASGVTAQVV